MPSLPPSRDDGGGGGFSGVSSSMGRSVGEDDAAVFLRWNIFLNLEDFFLREDLLVKSFIEKNSDTEFSLSEEKKKLSFKFA